MTKMIMRPKSARIRFECKYQKRGLIHKVKGFDDLTKLFVSIEFPRFRNAPHTYTANEITLQFSFEEIQRAHIEDFFDGQTTDVLIYCDDENLYDIAIFDCTMLKYEYSTDVWGEMVVDITLKCDRIYTGNRLDNEANKQAEEKVVRTITL